MNTTAKLSMMRNWTGIIKTPRN